MLACSADYHTLHLTDKLLLYILKESNVLNVRRDGYIELHVFPTHTALTDDVKTIGSCAFRYLIFKMPCGVEITTLADVNTNSDQIRDLLNSKEVNDHFTACLKDETHIVQLNQLTPPFTLAWVFFSHR